MNHDTFTKAKKLFELQAALGKALHNVEEAQRIEHCVHDLHLLTPEASRRLARAVRDDFIAQARQATSDFEAL